MVVDVFLVVAVALLAGVYVSWRAGRLDRLHARVAMARAALDAALLRRSSAAYELASSGLLDPATSLLLADAASAARGAAPAGSGAAAPASAGPGVLSASERPRDLAESDLTKALRAAFGQEGFRASLDGKDGAEELLVGVEACAHQVFIARKFYNDAVSATRDARRRPLARLLRLAGRAEVPEYFEMDDSLLAG